jgi:hypothetical protein
MMAGLALFFALTTIVVVMLALGWREFVEKGIDKLRAENRRLYNDAIELREQIRALEHTLGVRMMTGAVKTLRMPAVSREGDPWAH